MKLLLIYCAASVRVGIVCGFPRCEIRVLKWKKKKKKIESRFFCFVSLLNLKHGSFYVISDLVSFLQERKIMPSLKVIENAARKCNRKMQEVEGRAKQIYVFVEVQQEVQKEKSITIYNSGNLDNSVTMKEENLYPVIQLSANVT